MASGKKKQVPRCARNDNSRAFGRAVRPLVGLGMAGRAGVVVDGAADGLAPAVGTEGVDIFLLGDVDGLQESLRQVGGGAGGSGFYITADDCGDETPQGGAEITGGEVVAGEEVGQVFAERFRGCGCGLLFGRGRSRNGDFCRCAECGNGGHPTT